MTDKPKPNLPDIKLLVLDVDGVLTDGSIIINEDGTESKAFNTLDGHGIRMWRRLGLKVAFLSGRTSKPTEIRAKQLDIDYCLQECHDKLPEIKKLIDQMNIKPENVAYIGDDVTDLPVIKYIGFGVAVKNAVDEIKKDADYVTTKNAGQGAVRQVIEYILKNNGKWKTIMERYLA